MDDRSSDNVGIVRVRARRRIVVAVLLVLVAIGIAFPVTAAVLSQKDYGTAYFWKLPNRINYCGRRYYEGGAVQGNPELFRSLDSETGAQWSSISKTLSGRSIYAVTAPPSPPRYSVCTMVVYIATAHGRWEAYPLRGRADR